MSDEIELGTKVKDLVTGLTGIATSRLEYLNGCVQIAVSPLANEGKVPDSVWIDHQQLVCIGRGVADKIATGFEAETEDTEESQAFKRGGPVPNAPTGYGNKPS